MMEWRTLFGLLVDQILDVTSGYGRVYILQVNRYLRSRGIHVIRREYLESHTTIHFKGPARGLKYLVDVLRTKFSQVGYRRIKSVCHVCFLLT